MLGSATRLIPVVMLSLAMFPWPARATTNEIPADVESVLAAAEKTAQEGLKAIQPFESSTDLTVRAAVDGTKLFAEVTLEARQFYPKNPVAAAYIKEWKDGIDLFVAAAKAGKDPYAGCYGGVRGLASPIDGHTVSYTFSLPPHYSPAKKYPLRVMPSQSKWRTIFNKPRINSNDGSKGEFLMVSPDARGFSVCAGMGEVACIDCIDDFKKRYSVDETQVTIGGASIGGSVAYRLSAFHPDRFSGIHAMTAGPAVLLTAGNGRIDANVVVENYCNVAVCIWDAPKEVWWGANHSFCEQMTALSKKYPGYYPVKEYTDPEGAHCKIDTNMVAEGKDWVFKYRSDPWPKLVIYKSYNLRYDGAYWAYLDTMEQASVPCRIEAELQAGNALRVAIENADRFHLNLARELIGDARTIKVSINGGGAVEAQAGGVVYFARTGDKWGVSRERYEAGKLVKKHGLSGPVCDVFMEHPVLMVYTGADKAAGDQIVDKAVYDLWGPGNGAVDLFCIHHGPFERKADTEVTDDDIARKNLVLFGASNKILQRVAARLPVKLGSGNVTINGKTQPGSLMMAYPNPLNPERYILVMPDNFSLSGYSLPGKPLTSWNHVSTLDYPDYLVWQNGKCVLQGDFDAGWQPQSR